MSTISIRLLPRAASLLPRTQEQLIAQARPAVVRVTTDLGSASGFVIDSAGWVLTSNEAVVDAKQVTVILDSGTSHSATVIGRDMLRDLAILKIPAADLATLEFEFLDRVVEGSGVLALGHAVGDSEPSAVLGSVAEVVPDPARNAIWLRTDSDFDQGLSGAPLLDLQGKVVGVVSFRYGAPEDVAATFAISSSVSGLYIDELRAGKVLAR